MPFTVYCHTSPSGKQYIGYSGKGVRRRWNDHTSAALRGSAYLFHRAIRKYGPDAFTSEVLAVVSTYEEAIRAEVAEIAARGTQRPGGYNLTAGGEGSVGWVPSIATRLRISAANRGKRPSAEARERMGAARRGKKHTAETRAVISRALKGRVFAAEHCAKISDSKKGCKRGPHSALHAFRISLAVEAAWAKRRAEKEMSRG